MLFLRSGALEASASLFPYGGQSSIKLVDKAKSLCYQIYICLALFISVYFFVLVDVDMSLNYWDNKHLMTGPEETLDFVSRGTSL